MREAHNTQNECDDVPFDVSDSTVPKDDIAPSLAQANARLEEIRHTSKPPERKAAGWFDALNGRINELNEADPPIEIDIEIEIDSEIRLHPAIAIALLKRNKVAVGRLWLLARSMDQHGQGCVSIEALRSQFTDKQNRFYLCGWRRLRMLIEQGEGLFWERDTEGTLWLYQSGRVAALLGLDHVEGVSVFINVKQLLDIQSCRAHFYASWFSGRKTENPISRAVLTQLTGVSEGLQRLYEKIANVNVTPCIAVGERYERERMMEACYGRGAVGGNGGGVVFEFVDHKGKRGESGQSYIAWHLPNRYAGTHRQSGKSSRRKINRYLKRYDTLEKKLTLGNVNNVADETVEQTIPVRVFFDGAKVARTIRKSNLQTGDEAYWDGIKTKPASSDIYDVLPLKRLQGGVN